MKQCLKEFKMSSIMLDSAGISSYVSENFFQLSGGTISGSISCYNGDLSCNEVYVNSEEGDKITIGDKITELLERRLSVVDLLPAEEEIDPKVIYFVKKSL